MELFKKRKMALVLSGGSAKGLAHIGVIEVLEKNSIPIDAIVGTSMGALIGGLYAAGTLNDFKKEILRLSDNKLATFYLKKKLEKLNQEDMKLITPFIEKFTKKKNIEDLNIKFTAVATDLRTGKEVFIEQGSLLKAILASMCLPGVFHPIEIGKQILVDGGVIDPLPEAYGSKIAEKAIVVNAMPKEFEYMQKQDNVFQVISDASSIMTNLLWNLRHSIDIQKSNKENMIFLQLKTEKIGTYDFNDIPKIIDIGRKEAEKELNKIIELSKKPIF